MANLKYNSAEIFDIFLDTIQNQLYHPHYERTVEHAKWCMRIMTAEDQDEILIQYKRRETGEQKEQRVKVTNSRTQYVGNKVFNMFSEVSRSERTVNNINFEGDTTAESLMNNLKHFWKHQSLETYLDWFVQYSNFYDPNLFLVIEFENSDPLNIKPQAYPVRKSSEACINYEYYLGELQYLITKQRYECDSTEKDKKSYYDLYTCYGHETSYVMYVLAEDAAFQPDDPNAIQINIKIKSEPTSFIAFQITYETNLEQVPAIQVGYLIDPETEGESYVSPMYPAKELLTDLIWTKSEYDLAKALHGFYQKFIYVDDCHTCEGSGHVDAAYGTGYQKCPSCDGSGMDTHTSTQDIIGVTRVQSKDEHIPLNEMVHYEMIPMDLIKQMKEDVRDLERDILNSIFGSNVLERSEVAITATEKNYDWRAVNNSLLRYADQYVNTYKTSVMIIADIRQEGEPDVEYAFPSSFNLETDEDIIAWRNSATQAGMPYSILQAYDLQLMQRQNKDNPEKINMIQAKEQHRPFVDIPLQEKNLIFSNLNQYDESRILYLYFDEIMNGILATQPGFVDAELAKQREIVQAATQAKIVSLQANEPIIDFVPTSTTDGEEGQEEA